MIIINDKSYSFESLKQACVSQLSQNDLKEWEITFWEFIAIWFDDKIEEIQIKTSGSTGKPKIISHKKIFMKASASATCKFFKLNKDKIALLCLPIYSIGGVMMIVRSLECGMKLIVQKPSSNPLINIEKNIDFVAMVPMQVQKVIDENLEKLSFVKTVIIGGGKTSLSLEKEIIRNKISAFNTFGMTETISHIALKKIGGTNLYFGLENCFFSVDNDNCLIISAKLLGINNLITNDIVELIDKNSFKWLGRKDNAIETGGIKIIPEIVEQKIAHLFTDIFFISSLPDKILNNKIILIIEGNKKYFIDDFKKILNKFECPKEIFYLKEFKKTKIGKLDRKSSIKKILNRH